MAAETLLFQGMNRAATDYSGGRACEELINLRPTTDGLVPVKPFTTKFANSEYVKVFVHHTTDGDKYIGVRKVSSSHKVIVELIGTPAVLLFERTMTGADPYGYEATHKMNLYVENLFFAAAGNIILFSERAIDQYAPPFENVAFTWKGNAYVQTEANVPSIDYTISDGNALVGVWNSIAHISSSSDYNEVVAAVQNGLNAACENEPRLCTGPIIVAIAFKTTDGNTFWTGNWKIYDPVPTVRAASNSPYVDASIYPSSEFSDFFDKYTFGYDSGHTYGDVLDNVVAFGTKVKVTLSAVQNSNPAQSNYWNGDTSIIQSVEVYSSRPTAFQNDKSAFDGLIATGNNLTDYTLLLAQRDYEDMDLGSQPMYHQASVPMTSLLGTTQSVDLYFGGNIQTTNETLRVDAGALTRYGHLLSYNARFHYYDSSAELSLGKPFFLQEHTGTAVSTDVFVLYEDQNTRDEFYVGRWSLYDGDNTQVVIAPSVNITEVITRAVGSTYVQRYRMTASKAYNYSIHVGHMDTDVTEGTTEQTKLSNLVSAGVVPIVSGEPAAINVTEQYNPFVFRVEHSYLAPGNIIDVQPQMGFTADLANGEYPLNVFTERGVYALYQGSGDILYSAFKPMSDLVMYKGSGAVPVDMGTFFLSSGALWLISGRRITLVSEALSRGPHKYIRACSGYKKISGQDEEYSPTPVVSSPEYDVSDYLSQVEFEVFVGGDASRSIGIGHLSYNRFRQELYVSNGSYPCQAYSYVLSLKYRQWFKVPFCPSQDEQGSTLLKVMSSGGNSIDYLDLASESAGSVDFHLQSRPFSFGYQYSHVHRTLSMIRTALLSTNSEKAVLALYGSDDLQNWNLLAYAKRAGANPALKLSQIRTPSASRSWRYYTVCIGGKINTDTELGPFIVDYEPVVRRIG